jgi:hypothetical protein
VSDDDHRFYGDLAVWWPMISPPADYVEEAAFSASLLRSGTIPVVTVLELGSGGGHNLRAAMGTGSWGSARRQADERGPSSSPVSTS